MTVNDRYRCVLAVVSAVFVVHFLTFITYLALDGNHALACKSVVSIQFWFLWAINSMKLNFSKVYAAVQNVISVAVPLKLRSILTL